MRYKLIIESPINSHILDTKENRIVVLCNTKRPDLEFDKLEKLIEQANNSERYKIEMEQHRGQNPVFYDGRRNEDVYVLQERILKLEEENELLNKKLKASTEAIISYSTQNEF